MTTLHLSLIKLETETTVIGALDNAVVDHVLRQLLFFLHCSSFSKTNCCSVSISSNCNMIHSVLVTIDCSTLEKLCRLCIDSAKKHQALNVNSGTVGKVSIVSLLRVKTC